MDETTENNGNDGRQKDKLDEEATKSCSDKTTIAEKTSEDGYDGSEQLGILNDDSTKINETGAVNTNSTSTVGNILETREVSEDTEQKKKKTDSTPSQNDNTESSNDLNQNCETSIQHEKIHSGDTSIESSNKSESNCNQNTDTSDDYDPKDVEYIDNVAVYTNPKTGCKFKWDAEKNEWVTYTDATYTFEDDTHVYTSSDGSKYFWDKEKNAWFPKIDDDFMVKYQLNYGFTSETQNKPPEPEKPAEIPKPAPKPVEKGVKRKPSDPTWFEPDDKQNTKVYVSNLPLDITEEEFIDVMQKYGIIMRDTASNKLKIKLYTDPETKTLKGDGLCTYIRIESVDLALRLLDGSEVRGKKIHVERAKFQMRGNYDPKLKPKSKRRKDKDKLKKMQEKLFDWRPEKQRGERSKHERIVIIKNMFEPKLFDEDVGLILEFRKDLTDECSKCGDVRKVTLFDRHPDGVAQVNMADPEAADACVALLNGRWFGKRQLVAHIWDGRTKYRIAETDSQISQRLDNWDKFLTEDKDVKKEEEVVN